MENPIINSILDTDLYKFSMMQFVWHNAPRLNVEYSFKCRNDVDLSPYVDEIREEIDHFCSLSLATHEQTWLAENVKYLSPDYNRSLRDLRLNKDCVILSKPREPFAIRIHGNWYETILFEVPVLAIVNEVYFRNKYKSILNPLYESGMSILREKISCLIENANIPIDIIEFGTRRRFSKDWQDRVFSILLSEFGSHEHNARIIGTSNVNLARKYNQKAYGTMAHEFLMAHQVLAPLHKFQSAALQAWADEYQGSLGIALSDVVGMDAFLRDFHRGFAMLYAGCRHDSGDPYIWGDKLINHYKSLDIDPLTKTAVFSDGLDVKKMIEIANYFYGKIKTQFGVGTSLTNDLGVEPLQNVIKLVSADGMPVAKISDSSGKGMCEDQLFSAYLNHMFKDLH